MTQLPDNNYKQTADNNLQLLREADHCLKLGLWDRGQILYESVRTQMAGQLEADDLKKTLRPSERSKLARGVEILENRIKEIELKKPVSGGAGHRVAKAAGDGLPAEDMSSLGVLLKDVGIHDEAIDEFKRVAAGNPELIRECTEHIAETLIAKGSIDEGIDAFRRAVDLSPSKDSRIEILEKMAFAHETAGQKQAAVNAYREIILENPVAGRALQKIESLSGELKRSPLELAVVCRHPKWFFAASLIFALVFMVFNPFVKTVDNVDYFTLENDPDIIFYDSFKEVFGNDEFYVIAVTHPDLFSGPGLEMIRDITEAMEELPDIQEVISLANVDDIIGGPDTFEVRPFLDEIPEDKQGLAVLRQQVVQNALYQKNLISIDGKTTAILVEPDDRPEDGGLRKRLIEETHAVLRPYERQGVQFSLGGWTTTNLALSQYLKADMMIFVPATYLLITLATWLFFRNIRLTLLAVANITLCVGATRGLMGLTGIPVNNVTTIVIPLVMALALCDTVHIFSHMDLSLLNRFKDEKRALAHVLSKVGLPCFLTTLTTAIGFLSLSVSEITPVKQFAWIASAGMVFEFIFSFFFLPPLILFCNQRKLYQSYDTNSRMTRFLKGTFQGVFKYNRWVVAVGLMVVILALGASSQLRVETNLLEFFKKSSPVRTSLDFVESRLAGVGTLDISFKAPYPDAFKEPENLNKIDRVQQFVSRLNGVDKTISFVDFLKDMHQSFHDEKTSFYTLPDSTELISQYLLLYDSDDTEDYINSDYDHARLSARISVHGSEKQKVLIDQVQAFLNQLDPGELDIRITGRVAKDVSVINAIVKSQVYSLALATLVICVIMFLVFRSAAIAALSMLPNLFPILINFGIMGALGIALDTGTALIAAVALGIAVDDTVHFLSEYQRQRAKGVAVPKVLASVTQLKGRALLSSSLILSLGFAVTMLSRFVPVVNFGLLCSIIMITAVIGDLVLLPAIILLKKNR